jgi:predicted metalloprotease with PDZ domain
MWNEPREKIFNLGVNLDESGRVTNVHPGSVTGAARLHECDLLLSIDGQTLDRQGGPVVFRLLNEKVGQNISLRIRRGGEERELEMMVGSLEMVTYRMVDGRSPTPEQLKIRESWLKR